MEENFNQVQAAHLLQHSLRNLCIHENSPWSYAVFWRILPRNHPPPKWDFEGGACRSRGNNRNWILAWEDGFCNFATSMPENNDFVAPSSSVSMNSDLLHFRGLQLHVFFKMSHEIYNYGECLIGKVAAENSHRWIFKENGDNENDLSATAWKNSCDLHPRTWKAQFQSGLQTIALISVKEGVLQLGSFNKVNEDLSYVVQLQRKFSHLHTIPGFLLPHLSTPLPSPSSLVPLPDTLHYCDDISPSMRSLEALLAKLPSVGPTSYPPKPLSYHRKF